MTASKGKHDGARSGSGRKRVGPRRSLKITALVVAALLALILTAHVVLPPVILKFVNRELAEIPDSHAHIDDLDISLLRGAYTLEGITFQKLRAGDTIPVFFAQRVDFSVEWRALFQGKLVSEITLVKPRLNIVPSPTPRADDKPFDFAAARRTIENLFPFTINRFDIQDGALHFQDSSRAPPVDLRLDRIQATARGLTNAQEADDAAKKKGKAADETGLRTSDGDTGGDTGGDSADASPKRNKNALPASFRLTARAMGHAPLIVNLNLAPLADHPTFDLDAELKTLDLTSLNAFFRAYANVDVERGTFSVFTEVAAAEGRFRGYVKPLVKDIEVLDLDTDGGNVIRVAWEALVAGAARILENPPEEQVGTRIGFQGSFQNPETDLVETVIYLLRNAFIRALQPGLENSIRIKGGPTFEEEKTQKKKERERS